MKNTIFLLVMSFCLSIAAKPPVEPFSPRERIVFLGDSITHGGWYHYYLQLNEVLRHPGRSAILLNSGVNSDTAGRALARYEKYVTQRRPDRVFIMLGMNDFNYSSYQVATPSAAVIAQQKQRLSLYLTDMEKLVDQMLREQYKVVLITPTPYNQYSRNMSSKAVPYANESGLRVYSQAVRDLAGKKHLPVVDFHQVMTDMLLRDSELPMWGKSDRIHPSISGHLVMAKIVYEAMGLKSEVSTLSIDLSQQQYLAEKGRVSGISFAAGKVDLVYLPGTLPFPDFGDTARASQIFDLGILQNHEILKVRGLSNALYSLSINGKEVKILSREELAGGIDLNSLDTPSRQQTRAAWKWLVNLSNSENKLLHVERYDGAVRRLGIDPEQVTAALAALEEDCRKREAQAGKAAAHPYWVNVNHYREWRSARQELEKETEVYREKLLAIRPIPYQVTLKPVHEKNKNQE